MYVLKVMLRLEICLTMLPTRKKCPIIHNLESLSEVSREDRNSVKVYCKCFP